MLGVCSRAGRGKRHRVEKISTGKIGKQSNYYGTEIGRYVSIKKDAKKIEQSGISHVRKIRYKEESQSNKKNYKIADYQAKSKIPEKNKQKRPKPCFACGELHWYRYCNFRNKKCFNCGRVWHRSTHCHSKNKGNKIRKLKSNEVNDGITRKFVIVEINNKK